MCSSVHIGLNQKKSLAAPAGHLVGTPTRLTLPLQRSRQSSVSQPSEPIVAHRTGPVRWFSDAVASARTSALEGVDKREGGGNGVLSGNRPAISAVAHTYHVGNTPDGDDANFGFSRRCGLHSTRALHVDG